MRSVGIKTLKNKLSEYVKIASQGETVLITDRDRVVAELCPPEPTRGQDVADSVLADAVRRGWLRPALLPPSSVPVRVPAVMKLEQLLKELDQDRDDR